MVLTDNVTLEYSILAMVMGLHMHLQCMCECVYPQRAEATESFQHAVMYVLQSVGGQD